MNSFDGFFSDGFAWPASISFAGPDEDNGESSGEKKLKVTPEFDLARWLRGRGYQHQDECKRHVQLHCEMNELSFTDFWIALDEAWGRVKFDDNGRDNFSDAVDQMRKQLIPWPTGLRLVNDAHVQVASIAFYVSRYTKGNPFLLPIARIRQALGPSVNDDMTVSRILTWLTKHQLIDCVDPTYSRRRRKAKKYILGTLLDKRNEEKTRILKKPEDCGSAVSLKRPIRGRPPTHTLSDVQF